MHIKAQRRFEPDRRGRIVETALDVIAEHGVAGTTHRRIAEAASVPLGSITYYFDGIDALITEAFQMLSDDIAGRYRAALEAAPTREAAIEAVVQLACGGFWQTQRNMTLVFELYAYMARRSELRQLVAKWIDSSHRALERHFDPRTARALDTMLEGISIQNFVEAGTLPEDEVRRIIEKLAEP